MLSIIVFSKKVSNEYSKYFSFIFVCKRNKIVSSDNYNNDKHEEVINSDCYLLIQTEDKIVVAIAPKKSSRLYYKNTASNTAFVIPNDSYLKYIVSKEDNIQIDNDYISTNENTINLVNTINDYFINYNFD